MSDNNENQGNFEYAPYAEDVLAASMMAHSLNCCVERKYLDILNTGDSVMELVNNASGTAKHKSISWLKILQVGKPINNTAESCFGYIQKILLSCALPNVQLTFLVLGDSEKNEIYLGLRNNGADARKMSSTISSLNNFAKICWPGLELEQFDEENESLKRHFNTKYRNVQVLTGIPTLSDQGKAIGTIEHLIGGLRGQQFAYLVTATPVVQDKLDALLHQCREIGGQIESVKSLNISQSVQEGSSIAHTEGHSKFESWSKSESVTEKDPKAAISALLIHSGLCLAAGLFFPPAMAMMPAFETGLYGESMGTIMGMGGMSGMNILTAFIPQRTEGSGYNNGTSEQISNTTTYSKNMTKTLSRTLVNKHADAAAKKLDLYTRRFESAKATGAWDVSCYLFTQEQVPSASLQLKSILSGEESTLEPIRIHDVSHFVPKGTSKSTQLMVKFKDHFESKDGEVIKKEGPIFKHPFGEDFSLLQTRLTTRELSALVNFPLHSVPGISVVDSAPEFSLTPQTMPEEKAYIPVGNLLYGGSVSKLSVNLPIDTLSRHALVCGVNGSGKTNTVLSVLKGFLDNNRPFLVIEPAKTEYVDWAYDYNKTVEDPKKKIKVFMPGCEYYAKKDEKPSKLRLNPFEVINLGGKEMRVLSHIDRLKASLSAAFPMQDILPVVMEHLLYDLYTDVCPMIDKENVRYMECGFPTLSHINRKFIDDLMRNLGYAQENTQNIAAALRTRFNSLKFGWKGEMLNNPQLMDMSWDDFFGSPCVINLSYAGDDQDRAFMMSLILQFLYEYRIAETESGHYSFNDNKCRHLVVVEEAHRVMGFCPDPQMPQYKSGQMFSNFLSEVRAYGQGMMVVDQVPSRLIEDAIKNTNVKIIHKLVAADDSKTIADCIGLTPEQQKAIPRLSIGQAIMAGFNSADVMASNNADIYLGKVNKMK